jgi:hypothetical protein
MLRAELSIIFCNNFVSINNTVENIKSLQKNIKKISHVIVAYFKV